jgi:predicted AAA+ superfamily ATPase
LLTGSSARKLKSQSANLLASRALSIRLHPFTSFELENQNLELLEILEHGTVPAIIFAEQKVQALRAYVDTYLKEEIQQEALVRKLDKFFSFIDVAAQLNGEVVNFKKIARQLSVSDKTIGDYFQILIDTLLVIKLPGWDRSAKKQVIKSPKFYFFDCGVLNAAARELNSKLEIGSARYGRLFEQFVINEFYRLNDYFSLDYALSFYSTGSSEVDLVLSRSRSEPAIAIEIKSNPEVFREDLRGLELFSAENPKSRLFCVSTNKRPYTLELASGQKVPVLPYKDALTEVLKISVSLYAFGPK